MPAILPPGTEIEPFDDAVYCRMYKQTEKTSGNIIIPDTAKEEVFFARVLKVGPGKQVDVDNSDEPIRLPMKIKEGDDILFMRYHGERIEIEGAFYMTLRQDDVIAKIHMKEPAPNAFFVFA